MFRTAAAFRLPAIASLMIGLSIVVALTARVLLLLGQVRAQAAPPAQATSPAAEEGAPVRGPTSATRRVWRSWPLAMISGK